VEAWIPFEAPDDRRQRFPGTVYQPSFGQLVAFATFSGQKS
jgi:hypothetical protein